jgi:hypothetical protein
MINPNKCYRESGVFGLTFKGTAAQLAAVPEGIWTPAEGDLWYDTTNNLWKTYDGTNWNIDNMARTAAGRGLSPLIWDTVDITNLLVNPEAGFAYFDDFTRPFAVTTTDGYVLTVINSGTISASQVESGGVLFIDSAGNNAQYDGIQAQMPSCMVLPVAGAKIAFEARVKMNDTSLGISNFLVGLAGIDTTLMPSGAIDDAISKAAWYKQNDTTADKLAVINSKTSVEQITADMATVADGTWIKLGIVINGVTSVEFYADGVLVATHSTANAIPALVMCPSYVATVESAAKDAELSVDWIAVAQSTL